MDDEELFCISCPETAFSKGYENVLNKTENTLEIIKKSYIKRGME